MNKINKEIIALALKMAFEEAMISFAEMLEQSAVQFKARDGEQALLAFASAIRETNSEMFPAAGTKQ